MPTEPTDQLIEGTAPLGVPTEAVARALGVTPQSVRNWTLKGMPCLAAGGPGVSARYDLAACRTWCAANHMHTGHGGERAGAGRKRGRPRKTAWRGEGGPAPLLDRAEARQRAVDRIAELAAGPGHDPEALDLAQDLCKLTASDLVVLAHVTPEASGLTPAAIARLDKLLAVQQRQREMAREMGELVRARDVRAAAEEAYGQLRQALEAGARAWAEDLSAMLELDGGQRREVERRLRERVAGVVEGVRAWAASH